MKISENELLVRFDPAANAIVTYLTTTDSSGQSGLVLHTRYELGKLSQLTFREAARLIGEDLLLSMAGTRNVW